MTISRFLAHALLLVPAIAMPSLAQEKTWKASTARAGITPQQPVWLSGYAGQRVPTGKLHDLWLKVLALEDADGHRAVLLTSDLMGFSQAAYDDLCADLKKRYELERA